MKIDHGSVAAVVVTYNRHGLLVKCIDAVRSQTRPVDKIIVVDNGSTDTTPDWLSQQDDIVVLRQENMGGAGGFATGLKAAFESGYSWFWCMDDDGYAERDCLEKLIETGEAGFHYIAPNLVDEDGNTHFARQFSAARTDIVGFCGGPFNGVLLSRQLVQRIGYPIAKFFIWGDEWEYCNRIVESGFPVVTVKHAVFYHKRTTINYRLCRRGYYYIRNRVYTYRLFQGIYRSKAVYGCGVLLTTVRFLFNSLRHGNIQQAISAIQGFVHGVIDPLEDALVECHWWGVDERKPISEDN